MQHNADSVIHNMIFDLALVNKATLINNTEIRRGLMKRAYKEIKLSKKLRN